MYHVIEYEGMLIVIDGPDCTGKGKQIEMLMPKVYANLDVGMVLKTEEPWRDARSPNGLWIDRLLNADNLEIPKEVNPGDGKLLAEPFQTLYFNDRCTDWAKRVLPALKAGKLVISDRERMSTMAYGYAYGVSLEEIACWHTLLPEPDLMLWIDIPAEEAIRRKAARKGLTEHFEDPASMIKIRDAYQAVDDSGLIPNLVRIDGLGTPEEVHARIWEEVKPIVEEMAA